MGSSIRKLTDQQFADGTTIDGTRLDQAAEETVERINAIPKGDLARRFVPTTYCWGFLPRLSVSADNNQLPFMFWENSATQKKTGTETPDFQNVQRVKGLDEHDEADFYLWTTAFYFKRPVVIDEVLVVMAGDGSDYSNAKVYDSTPPGDRVDGDPVDDFHVAIEVDSPFAPEDRSQTAVVLHRGGMPAPAESFCEGTVGAFTDMSPAFGGVTDDLEGAFAVHCRDLNIPIHRDARVRLTIALPRWENAENPWGAQPSLNQYYSISLSVLEEVEEA